ncbi:hypothetical protein GPECTOR_34g729 [Gonium pectorale]|uniref:Uncharacterized protein n=1 Tax=Gonium pectorale TaxID=33097 RepID=A0A150GDZ2_GONPE|nr:hypothetical protein GPECTOR_34g729 [Gonium pectorale]|eukprot:KXZ47570.1 hypothetical protein GPECTOR_34g729 [Gonium pectorale]
MDVVKERCEKYLVSRWYMAHELGRLLERGNWAQLLQECLGELDAASVPVEVMQALMKSVRKRQQSRAK